MPAACDSHAEVKSNDLGLTCPTPELAFNQATIAAICSIGGMLYLTGLASLPPATSCKMLAGLSPLHPSDFLGNWWSTWSRLAATQAKA